MSLRHLGYEVDETSDPREALLYLEDHSHEYDLAVLDMLMPHLSGDELFERLRGLRPKLPVVVMSGYSREEAVDKILSEPSTYFMLKPFTVEDLSQIVCKALDDGDSC